MKKKKKTVEPHIDIIRRGIWQARGGERSRLVGRPEGKRSLARPRPRG
jgi:hypothetical protein